LDSSVSWPAFSCPSRTTVEGSNHSHDNTEPALERLSNGRGRDAIVKLEGGDELRSIIKDCFISKGSMSSVLSSIYDKLKKKKHGHSLTIRRFFQHPHHPHPRCGGASRGRRRRLEEQHSRLLQFIYMSSLPFRLPSLPVCRNICELHRSTCIVKTGHQRRLRTGRQGKHHMARLPLPLLLSVLHKTA